MIDSELSALQRRYRLPGGWQPPELFGESVTIADLSIELLGLTTRHDSGRMAFGSAAELDRQPVGRAYFELLERAAVLDATEQPAESYVLLDSERRPLRAVPHRIAFPETERPDRQRYSVSNGVAAHGTWLEACRAAARERVERDRVLRSWYGQLPVVELAPPREPIAKSLADRYDFFALGFGEQRVALSRAHDELVFVAGVAGFPAQPGLPLLLGFGTGPDSRAALCCAFRECTQRLGFLWGEAIPDRAPEPSPTPDFHQEHYLFFGHHGHLRRWIAGRHFGASWLPKEPMCNEVGFVDLTPEELRGRLWVAKAVSDSALPLVFGVGHPHAVVDLPPGVRVHPIA